MYMVKFVSYGRSWGNVYDSKEFTTLGEAREFASKCYDPSIWKRVPSPAYMNSKWMYERVE